MNASVDQLADELASQISTDMDEALVQAGLVEPAVEQVG